MTATRIEIPISKAKLLLHVGGSLMFVVLSIGLITTIAYDQTKLPPVLVQIVGVTGILFFGMTGYYGLKSLLSGEMGLIIDREGLTDHTGATSVGFIEWRDITGIRSIQIKSTKILLIDTSDPQKHLGRASNKVLATLMQGNMRMYGTPITIASNTLNYDFEELEQLLTEYFENYKSKG